ncbi:FliH/SctL family protein [Yoonia maricola]|nr:hypothetical protein [Yoonia maricola]
MLESFESETLLDQAPDEGFEKGFTQGHAAGLAAAAAGQEALTQELVQNIADLQFKYDEARGEITRAIGPLFAALAQKVFPQCVAEGFVDQIVALLHKTASRTAERSFTLRLHPQYQEAVSAALMTAGLDVNVSTDPALSPHAAWVAYDTGAAHIDCDQLLDDIKTILSSVDFIETRSETHG